MNESYQIKYGFNLALNLVTFGYEFSKQVAAEGNHSSCTDCWYTDGCISIHRASAKQTGNSTSPFRAIFIVS
jgi:hypothetical protein